MPIFTPYQSPGEFNTKIYIGNGRIKLKLNFLSCLDQIWGAECQGFSPPWRNDSSLKRLRRLRGIK